MTDTVVDISSLTVVRGRVRAVDDVDVRVTKGSITGLLGPSGCGKTTLLRSVVGTQAITRGSVTVFGLPAGDAGLRRRVGYVTQSPSVYPELSVEENVRYFASLYGTRDAVDDALSTLDLAEVRHRRTSDLSGGQRSRVSIACSLVGNPELMVLDEPTVGLDPILRVELWRRFRALADTGTTLLVSSHVMDEADHCDALVLMRAGRVVAQSTPAGLRADTGQDDLESAFIAVIEKAEAAA
ncbi:ABC transporter ATP-binding protein [Williamsia sp. SKLECPSW1]